MKRVGYFISVLLAGFVYLVVFGASVGLGFQNVTVSPSVACIGSTITISGSGALPNSRQVMSFLYEDAHPLGVPGFSGIIAMSNTNGEWSVPYKIPATAMLIYGYRGSIPTPPGGYFVRVNWNGGNGPNPYYGGAGLTINDCSDDYPPNTTPTPTGTAGDNGWYRSNVGVSLRATDNNGGSGVTRIQYSLNGSGWQSYSTPFSINRQGKNVVWYRAIDEAGNVEASKRLLVNIDKTPPAVSNLMPTGAIHFNQPVLNARLSDAHSGIASGNTVMRLNGKDVSAVSAKKAARITYIRTYPMAPGAYRAEIVAKDRAGNTRRVSWAFTMAADSVNSHTYYSSWYDNLNSRNWVLMATPARQPKANSLQFVSIKIHNPIE